MTETETSSRTYDNRTFFSDTRYFHVKLWEGHITFAVKVAVVVAGQTLDPGEGPKCVLAWGAACCSPRDQFSRRRGREVALHRLRNVLAGGKYWNHRVEGVAPRLMGIEAVENTSPPAELIHRLVRLVVQSHNAPRWLPQMICEWCDQPVDNGRTHGEGACFRRNA